MRFFGIHAALLGVLLSACATGPSSNDRPAWIENPGEGVSASAAMHVKGRAAQEELAISRARAEFARRVETIDASRVTNTTLSGGRVSTTSVGTVNEQVQQVEVKAVVKAKWLDQDNNVLWVWLVPAN